MNYYNDNDPRSAAWIRELIKSELIPMGDVDERSITDVTKSDVKGYTQCHFFAGIAGWSEALRLAGWPTDRPVWTGSCPCQPYSCAGKGQGDKDERDLWPEFYRLIRECKPNTVFGEQVEAAIGYGWIDRVFADLEDEGYACGSAVLGAHSVGAPHVRQRLYWVADAESSKWQGKRTEPNGGQARFTNSSESSGMADSDREHGNREGFDTSDVCRQRSEPSEVQRSDSNFWSNSIWITCADGKARRIEPEIFPLADGVPGRVGLLRGAGNAIIPEAASEFIMAFLDCIGGLCE